MATAMARHADHDLDEWFRAELIDLVAKCPGYRRTKRYKVHTHTDLAASALVESPVPTWIAMHEFDGPEPPWKELKAGADENKWATNLLSGFHDVDFGVFVLKDVYGEDKAA